MQKIVSQINLDHHQHVDLSVEIFLDIHQFDMNNTLEPYEMQIINNLRLKKKINNNLHKIIICVRKSNLEYIDM